MRNGIRRIHWVLLPALLALLQTDPGSATLTPSAPDNPKTASPLSSDLMWKQPFLIYRGHSSQMQVLWQLTATANSTLDWGLDSTYALGSVQTTEYGRDHQHAHTIPDLAPGVRYFYRVTEAGFSYAGTFQAAPPADAPDLKFTVYGDSRTNPDVHDQVAGGLLATIAADPAFHTFVLALGDLVFDGASEADWTTQVFSPDYPHIRQEMGTLPFHSCIGNHEGDGVLFVKYFPYPFAGGRYWSFDYGPAHFVILDQYTSYLPGSDQLEWLNHDLATSTKPWKFIALHEPGWSAGGSHENNVAVQMYIQPLCLQYGVSIVFGGHNHYYARAMVDGVAHITSGGGGAPLYSPNPAYPHIVTCASAHHFCKIAIAGNSLGFQAVTPGGTILDSFMLGPGAAVNEPVATEMRPWAAPNPFSRETVLHWRTPAGSSTRLVILDVTGRPVRSFAPAAPGDHAAIWDGTDAQGRPAGSGVYFYRPGAAGDAPANRLVLIR